MKQMEVVAKIQNETKVTMGNVSEKSKKKTNKS